LIAIVGVKGGPSLEHYSGRSFLFSSDSGDPRKSYLDRRTKGGEREEVLCIPTGEISRLTAKAKRPGEGGVA